MALLHAGVDTAVIALWLGHADIRSTAPYLHADLAIKERALAMTSPATAQPGRYRPPDALLAIPAKRFDKRLISFLTAEESQALIEAPDQTRWEGRRDRALLMLALQTGLRVSEIINLNCADIIFGDGAHVQCHGLCRIRHRPCYAAA